MTINHLGLTFCNSKVQEMVIFVVVTIVKPKTNGFLAINSHNSTITNPILRNPKLATKLPPRPAHRPLQETKKAKKAA